MPTAGGRQRFLALDGLRGIAAIGIIGTHAGFASGRSLKHDIPAALLGRLDIGVAIFFLLSGFLLYRPFAIHSLGGASAPSIMRFWWRRSLRIFPALWLCIVVTLSVINTTPATWSDWWHYLLLVQVYEHQGADLNLPHLWTLSVEVAFYALIPLLGALATFRASTPEKSFRRQLQILGVLVVIALGFNLFQDRFLTYDQAQLWFPAYLDWFALGMLLALLSAATPGLKAGGQMRRIASEWAAAPGTCLTLAAVLWGLTMTQLGTPRFLVRPTFWQWTVQHYLFGAAAFFVMLPVVLGSGGAAGAILSSRAGQIVGPLSYAVYLWHLPLLALVERGTGYLPFSGHFWVLSSLTLVVSLAVASVSWYGLERPVLRHGGRSWRGSVRLRGKPASDVVAEHSAPNVRDQRDVPPRR